MTKQKLAPIALAATLAVAAAFASAPAGAALLVQSASVGGVPTGVAYANFNDLSLGSGGGASLASNGQSIQVNFFGNAQAVQGAAGGLYAAPFLSNNNGANFGTPNGADNSTYLSSGSYAALASSAVELVLPSAMMYFGLLWGSVDNYNFLDFYAGNTLVGTIGGNDVTTMANGDQGAQGTYYVNILSDLAFTRVVARSNGYAFEFDNVAFNAAAPGTPVPAPATLSLMALALLGIAAATRRRRAA